MTVKEIDEQIAALNAQRSVLIENENKQRWEKARRNVGRCFKIRGAVYAKVIDVPQRSGKYGQGEVSWSQYPAIFIGGSHPYKNSKDPILFYYDTLSSAVWSARYDFKHKYEEISPEEFAAVFEQKLAELRKIINA